MSLPAGQTWKPNPKLEGLLGPNGTPLSLCAACNGKHRKHICGYGKVATPKAKKPTPQKIPKPLELAPPDPRVVALIEERMAMDPLPEPDGPLPHELDEDGRPLNHNFCVSCVGGGDLLCCDGCTASIHHDCLTPPIEVTINYWLCAHSCRSNLRVGSYPEDQDFFCTVCLCKQKKQEEPLKHPGARALITALRGLQPMIFELPNATMEDVKGNNKLCRPEFMGDRSADDNSFDLCGACTTKLPPRLQGDGHSCGVCGSRILRYIHIPRSFGTIKEKTPNQIAALQAQRAKAKENRQQHPDSSKRGRSPTPEFHHEPEENRSSDSEELFECESGCGFEHVDKDLVEEHEQSCELLQEAPAEQSERRDSRKRKDSRQDSSKNTRRKRPDQPGHPNQYTAEALIEPEPQELFECESNCGFEHIYKYRVEQHEVRFTLTCEFRLKRRICRHSGVRALQKHCAEMRGMRGLAPKVPRVRKPDPRRQKNAERVLGAVGAAQAAVGSALPVAEHDGEHRSKRARQGDRRGHMKAEDNGAAIELEAEPAPDYDLDLPAAEVYEKQHTQALQDFAQFYSLVSKLPRQTEDSHESNDEEAPADKLVLELKSWQRIMSIWEKTQPIGEMIQTQIVIDAVEADDHAAEDGS